MTPEDKLFHASVAAMQGLIIADRKNKRNAEDGYLAYFRGREIADEAHCFAKALLAELDKEGAE